MLNKGFKVGKKRAKRDGGVSFQTSPGASGLLGRSQERLRDWHIGFQNAKKLGGILCLKNFI